MFFLASVAVRVVIAYAITYLLKVSRQDHSWKQNPVTNCHGIYFHHFQSKILAKMPSPFEIKIISIMPLGFIPVLITNPTHRGTSSKISGAACMDVNLPSEF
jgi:hypothetical protein